MTKLAHGKTVDDSELPVGVRWGVGGAIAQKFAQEGFFTVVTTRAETNAVSLTAAIREQGGECMIVELDLSSGESVLGAAFLHNQDPQPTSATLSFQPKSVWILTTPNEKMPKVRVGRLAPGPLIASKPSTVASHALRCSV